jgi:tetratricopeptide (TPR) repeat protein
VFNQVCLAVAYDKLGRHADAESMLVKVKASSGDAAAYQYAEIYAQWGNTSKALESLETALRLRDPGLVDTKNRSPARSAAERATLPGDRAGIEVSELNGAVCSETLRRVRMSGLRKAT